MPRIFKIVSRHDEALSTSAELSYEDRMIKHLFKFFPDECAELGDRGVREMVGEGVRRAARREIHGENEVAKYIHVMLACGNDFENDPRFPWAPEILGNPAYPPRTKADRLVVMARNEIEAAAREGER